MHQALYRKWRPKTFDEVCGQEHITDILRYEVEKGLMSHAYLFCGSRGTGKTTCAKILACAANCENPVNGNPCGKCRSCLSIADGSATDVLEMDAASNNRVDDIRNILDEVVYTPSALKYRVYIIDEVHMLSGSAFNALLKTLEEPPSHVIFILATTEMQKLPATIISRCQRFEFHRIPVKILTERLKYIAAEERIALDDEAAMIVSRLAQGGMRDAISLFELCAAGGNSVTAASVSDAVGFSGRGPMSSCVRSISKRDCAALFGMIAAADSSAKDLGVFWQELIAYYRDLLVMKTAGKESAVKYLDLTDSEAEMTYEDSKLFSKEQLSFHCRLLDDAYSAMQRPGTNRRTVAELTLIRLCDDKLSSSVDAILSRIEAIEAKLSGGVVSINAKETVQEAEPAKESGCCAPASEKAEIKIAEPVKKPSEAAPAASQEMKRIRRWAEIVDQLRKTRPAIASFLQSVAAYQAGNKIIIKYQNKISEQFATAPDNIGAFCSAISQVLEMPVSAAQLFFEQGTEEELKPETDTLASTLDKLIDN